MSLHVVDILQILRDDGIPIDEMPDHPFITDRIYSVPTDEWVHGPFSKYLFQKKIQENLTYAENKWDCEDFCLWAMVEARLCHKQLEGVMTAFPFGYVAYTPEKRHSNVKYRVGFTDHAVNWFLADRRGKPGVYFFEPQRPNTIHLTSEEIRSIRFLYL